jgi:hypothetical protein
MNELNASMNSMSSLPLAAISDPALFWLVATVTFISICGMLFFISTNFRDFVVGSVTTAVLFGIGSFSNYVAASDVKGDDQPFIYVCWTALFVITALMSGKLITRTKKFKEWWLKWKS